MGNLLFDRAVRGELLVGPKTCSVEEDPRREAAFRRIVREADDGNVERGGARRRKIQSTENANERARVDASILSRGWCLSMEELARYDDPDGGHPASLARARVAYGAFTANANRRAPTPRSW